MKKAIFLVTAGLTITVYALLSRPHALPSAEEKIAAQLLAQVDSFSATIGDQFLPAVTLISFYRPSTAANRMKKRLQQLFLQTRLAYKKFEWAAEYFYGIDHPRCQRAPHPGSGAVRANPATRRFAGDRTVAVPAL